MNSILVTENGPLECNGEFDLVTVDGTLVAHETQTWLCRCGSSSEKPYCDGSHEKTGFVAACLAEPASNEGDDAATGPVRVTLRRNGPLRLEGPCEVRDQNAHVLFRGMETALCRCGQSKKKPFCDGTHRQIEFIA